MGCHHSKPCLHACQRKQKKNKAKCETHQKEISAQDGSGKLPLQELSTSPEKLLESYEQQLKVLHKLLSASGTEREQLLKDHQHGEICTFVHRITEKVKSEVTAELAALHEKQAKISSEQHHKETEEMRRVHSEEKHALKEAHTAAEAALKGQIEELTSDLKLFTMLKQRVKESTLNRDLRRNIETHGSPGEFWEQEQESLLIVIEMKSERLQEQGSKLRQMEALVEKNLSLEDQVLQVLQQNEDLRVRIENYQTLIHQLSKEQNETQEALEKQTLQMHKLNQEKEELLFKLLHSQDSRSSFHMPALIPAEVSHS